MCVCSRLNESLEVRLLTSAKTASPREATNVLTGHSSLPSYVVEKATSLRVKRHGPQQTMLWSQEVSIRTPDSATSSTGIFGGDKLTRDARLIKVSLEVY